MVFLIITDIIPQKKYKNRLSVFIDGTFSFGIDEFDALKLKLKVGKELSQDELSKIKDDVIFVKAKDYALSLASARFYTEKMLKTKLLQKEFDNETIEKVIEFLKEYKFIDDFAYAKKYIYECLEIKKIGKIKIKMLLKEKGIDQFLIDEAMELFDFDEIENNNLEKLILGKLSENFDYKNIMKVKRYFVSKGYSFDSIDKAIRKIVREEGALDV